MAAGLSGGHSLAGDDRLRCLQLHINAVRLRPAIFRPALPTATHREASVVTVDQVLSILQTLVPIIAMFVAMPIFPQWTKNALAVAQAIINSDGLRNFLHLILNDQAVKSTAGDARTAAMASVIDAKATPEVKQAAASLGLDWSTFVAELMKIVTLILSALGQRR